MPWTVEESRKLAKETAASISKHHYKVEFTAKEAHLIVHAALLNRRMLGDRPEHDTLDNALALVDRRLREHWESSEEGARITAAYAKMIEEDL